MTAFGNYTLWDNQDVSKFYLLFQKNGGGQMPLLLPPGYATGYYYCPSAEKDVAVWEALTQIFP